MFIGVVAEFYVTQKNSNFLILLKIRTKLLLFLKLVNKYDVFVDNLLHNFQIALYYD